jgi:pyruvate dehydrogenase E1 component alpha subunit
VVFLVQNNGYAISVPLAKQTAAPTLAAKGIGYGIPSLLIDGNDAAAVYAAVQAGIDPDRGDHLPDRGAHQRRRRHPLPGRG